jgi:hypothetical protein
MAVITAPPIDHTGATKPSSQATPATNAKPVILLLPATFITIKDWFGSGSGPSGDSSFAFPISG